MEFYSIDSLYHSVFQCLSSISLKISKEFEVTIVSVKEFQSFTIFWLHACFQISASNWGLNSFMLWLLVPLYLDWVKYAVESILSISLRILYVYIMSPLYSIEYNFKLWSLSWYGLSPSSGIILVALFCTRSTFLIFAT